eukprot:1158433-Pelagomonas_calceolata.AAC.5
MSCRQWRHYIRYTPCRGLAAQHLGPVHAVARQLSEAANGSKCSKLASAGSPHRYPSARMRLFPLTAVYPSHQDVGQVAWKSRLCNLAYLLALPHKHSGGGGEHDEQACNNHTAA